jgi:Terpene cyclase DEP1
VMLLLRPDSANRIGLTCMRVRYGYLLLCVLGVVLPYWQFVPWVLEHGLNLRLFVSELFANRIGGFFGMDVLVSAVALCVFASAEGRRLGMRDRWMPVVAVLLVGVSLGLPLFLYLREIHLDRRAAASL